MQTSAVEGASAASPGQIPIALTPQQAHALGQPRRRRCGRMLPLRKRRNRLRPAPKMGAWKDHLAMAAERSSAAAAASEGLRCLRAEAADDGDVGGSRAPVDEDIGCLLPDAQKEDALGAGARIVQAGSRGGGHSPLRPQTRQWSRPDRSEVERRLSGRSA